ncbi:DUF885 domain-containing protein [Sulfidibacter corallicola]|uniref:DUF885 domain-containing protein n=1 Tax=Sulfidibacter corallicola TaxID=2818388 RepID=A0A8A4TLH1_SULCO|nr:DUF885 domain-containing protein [Sulfidibacter corallicola]QTD50839.1 DUF885 domain-containing protein [Sulfidibacter corallicola]
MVERDLEKGAAHARDAAETPSRRNGGIREFFDEVLREQLEHDPEMLTRLGLAEALGIPKSDDRLTRCSPCAAAESLNRAERHLARLRQFEDAGLSTSDRVSKRVLKWLLEDRLRDKPFLHHGYVVNQLNGIQLDLPAFMVGVHPLHDLEGCETYVARLHGFREKFRQLLESLRLREEMAILPPRFVVTGVLEGIDRMLAGHPEHHPLVTTLAGAAPVQDQRARWLGRAREAVEQVVFPEYRRLASYLRELLPHTDARDGVWKLPNGEAYYHHLLHHHTSLNLPVDKVHDLGEDEVARIHAEMERQFVRIGRTQGTLSQRMRALFDDPAFRYPDDEAGREHILRDYRAIVEEAQRVLPDWFDLQPASELKVARVPRFKERGAPGAYYMAPAMDGSRPGVFFVNLRDIAETPRFTMRTLAYHEAVPGHHFQMGLAQEITDLPHFRRTLSLTAYVEGWALYTENLASEMGLNPTPYDELGRLQAELLRAARLVVDTGIHALRWTRRQAIDYMIATGCLAPSDAVTEVERYIVFPAQACAYKIGMLHIQDLRFRAEDRLGSAFDVKAFHRAVLRDGALPLPVLADRVREWIRDRALAKD